MNQLFDNYALAAITGAVLATVISAQIAWKAGKSVKTAAAYYAGDGLGSKSYDSTYLATNVAFTAIIIIFTDLDYTLGWWCLAAPVCWVFGMVVVRYLFLQVFIGKFEAGKEPLTLHEFCANRFGAAGEPLRRALAVATIVGFVGTVTIEVLGLLYSLSAFGMPIKGVATTLTLFIFLIMVWYARKSGFPGVVATDKWQIRAVFGILLPLLTLAFVVLCYFGFGPGLTTVKSQWVASGAVSTPILDGVFGIIGFIFILVPLNLCVGDMWQRCYAVRWEEEKVKQIASLKNCVLFAIAFLIPICLGIAAANFGVTRPDGSFIFLEIAYTLISSVPTEIGLVLTAILFAGLASSALSTADTLLVCGGFVYQYDYVGRDELRNSVQASESTALSLVHDGVLICGIAGMLLVVVDLVFPKVTLIDIGYAVFSNQVAFAPILLYAAVGRDLDFHTHTRPLTHSVYLSIVLCFIVALFGAVSGQTVITYSAPLIGIAVTTCYTIYHIVSPDTEARLDEDDNSHGLNSPPDDDDPIPPDNIKPSPSTNQIV